MNAPNPGENGNWLRLFPLVYLLLAAVTAWQTVEHYKTATSYFGQICEKANKQNVGAQLLQQYNRENPIRGFIFSSTIKHLFDLPSLQKSSFELGAEIPHLAQLLKHEASVASWWSWLLLSLSLIYMTAAVAIHSSFRTRHVLFSFACVSAVFFLVGITAPAMMVFTNLPIPSSKMSFVLQHNVQSIFSAIAALFSSGNWLVAILILTFSIITPLAKTSLTLIAITTKSSSIKLKIAKLLQAIGKWSMADVFVAGVFLACFALQSQQGTKAVPCLGLKYFTGYCLLSMMTTLLLVKTNFADENQSSNLGKNLGRSVIGSLFGLVLLIITVAGVYTYEKQPATPIELFNSQVRLAAHHWQKTPLSVPSAGSLTIELGVPTGNGNSIHVALIPADQLSNIEQAHGATFTEKILLASLPAFKAVQAKNYHHTGRIDKGEFFIVLQDTTLGILSDRGSDVEIHAYLAP